MAELLIHIGKRSDTPGDYDDGDCLCAFNDRRIRHSHADMVCHWKHAEKTPGHNCRSVTSLAYRYLSCICTRHVVRVNVHECLAYVTDILGNVTGEPELLGPPNHDWDTFFRLRKRNPRHRVFGSDGAEVYHDTDSRIDVSVSAIDQSWNLIQEHSAHRYLTDDSCPHCGHDHNLWCLGGEEPKVFLPVRAVNFSDAEADGLIAPQLTPEGNVIANRNIKCHWREILDVIGVSEADVLDKTVPVGRSQSMPELRWTVKLHTPANDRSRLESKAAGGRLPNQPG